MFVSFFSSQLRPSSLNVNTRLFLCFITLLGLAYQPSIATAQSEQISIRNYSVVAGPLPATLETFSKASNLTLQYNPAEVTGVNSPGVNGNYSAAQALAALLQGTGLEAVATRTGYWVQKNGAAQTLPSVSVTASSSSITENSGSYTTPMVKTATPLELSIRDTPQSISVVTSERLEDQAMPTIADALRGTIGLSVKPVDRGRNSISARGFDVNNFQLDGMPTESGNVGLETTSSVIYDRIEIVRGATGLLSGAGDPSAAVNMVRKHADSDTLTGSITGQLGSWEQRTATVDATAPLNGSGTVRGRVVAHLSEQDAFVDLEHTKNTVIYGVLDADLNQNTQLSIGASNQFDQRDGVIWAGFPYWFTDGSRAYWSRSRTTATEWNRWDTRRKTAFATLKHQFGNQWAVRADFNYQQLEEESLLLWMWGNPDRETGIGREVYPYHYLADPTQTQLSLSASGPFTLWGREHELALGATRYRLTDSWSNRDAVDEIPEVGNFYEWDGSYPEIPLGEFYIGSDGKTLQTGVYAVSRLQLLDALRLIIGGRLSNWERDELAGAWTTEPYTLKHDGEFTPYAGLVYDLSTVLSAYVSYADIFKPQTYRDSNGDFLDPLIGKVYEVGLKGEFLEGALNASAAVFRTDQDNFAIRTNPGTNPAIHRAGQGVKVDGYEMEMIGKLNLNWDITAGWTQFSGKESTGADIAVEHARKQFKLFTKYDLDAVLDGLTLGGGVSWEGNRPMAATHPVSGENVKVGQPAYSLWELMARQQFADQWYLQLNVYNLLDETYRSGSRWWGADYTYGEPRKAVLTLNYKF